MGKEYIKRNTKTAFCKDVAHYCCVFKPGQIKILFCNEAKQISLQNEFKKMQRKWVYAFLKGSAYFLEPISGVTYLEHLHWVFNQKLRGRNRVVSFWEQMPMSWSSTKLFFFLLPCDFHSLILPYCCHCQTPSVEHHEKFLHVKVWKLKKDKSILCLFGFFSLSLSVTLRAVFVDVHF